VPRDAQPESHRQSESLDELVGRRVEFLAAYQNAAYARRYFDRVRQVREAEADRHEQDERENAVRHQQPMRPEMGQASGDDQARPRARG